MALLTLNDKPIILKDNGGGEMVSLEIKTTAPQAGAPYLWYCDNEGVKRAEAFNTTVQCLKNSAIIALSSLVSFSGMNKIDDFKNAGETGIAHLYQIVDNASFTFR